MHTTTSKWPQPKIIHRLTFQKHSKYVHILGINMQHIMDHEDSILDMVTIDNQKTTFFWSTKVTFWCTGLAHDLSLQVILGWVGKGWRLDAWAILLYFICFQPLFFFLAPSNWTLSALLYPMLHRLFKSKKVLICFNQSTLE